MNNIIGRIKFALEQAGNLGYRPLRIWLTPGDYRNVTAALGVLHGPITINDIPVTIDMWWSQPTRIVCSAGNRIIF